MYLWRLSEDSDHYKDIVPVNKVDMRYFDLDHGAEFRKKWYPFPVKFVDYQAEDERTRSTKPIGDITILSFDHLMCSNRALNVLKPVIEKDIRIYDLEKSDWFYVEVLTEIDCFDYAQSTYRLGSFSGVSQIRRYVFKEDCLGNQPIFTMPGMRRIFILDELKNLIDDNGLRGLKFTQIIDVELPPW